MREDAAIELVNHKDLTLEHDGPSSHHDGHLGPKSYLVGWRVQYASYPVLVPCAMFCFGLFEGVSITVGD